MKRSLLLLLLGVGSAFACGGTANRDNSSIASVTGKLGAPVPAGAKVAIVWRRAPSGFIVSHEAPIVSQAFSFDLSGPPPEAAFFFTDGIFGRHEGPDSTPPSAGGGMPAPPDPPSLDAGTSGSEGVKPQDVVSGTVSAPLSAAGAGFVIYADKNGNGKLDVSDTGETPDEILGGSDELVLAYLRDGSDLDLEKGRDKLNQLPRRGYNLFWTDEERWVPLTSVSLKVGAYSLPGPVCSSGGSAGGSGAPTPEVPPKPETDETSGYPPPSKVICSPDGTYFYYAPTPPPVEPPAPNVCNVVTEEAGVATIVVSLPPGPIPADWPCTVGGGDGGIDGGPADGGVFDASVPPSSDAGAGPTPAPPPP